MLCTTFFSTLFVFIIEVLPHHAQFDRTIDVKTVIDVGVDWDDGDGIDDIDATDYCCDRFITYTFMMIQQTLIMVICRCDLTSLNV